MKALITRLSAPVTLLVGLLACGAAQANWTFQNTVVSPVGSATPTTFTSQNTSASTATVQLAAAYVSNTSLAAGTGTWGSATLTNQGSLGQGVCSISDGSNGCVNPDHAVDNNVNTEGVLLKFSSSVILSSIGLGWTNSSTSVDVSLFRWVGAGDPTLLGANAKNMSGWELVGNYGDMKQDTTPMYNLVNTNQANGSGAGGSGNKGSSWWLISAYNSAFTGASQTRDGGTLDNGNDYFKLYGVTGTTCSKVSGADCGTGGRGTLPEPASLALASVALLGVLGVRRRRQA